MIPRAILTALLLGTAPVGAEAASEKYCARYSSAIAETLNMLNAIVDDIRPDIGAEEHLVNRAFSTCLNQDLDPKIPFFMGVTDWPPGSVLATDPNEPPMTEMPTVEEQPTAEGPATANPSHDSAWEASCRRHFPKSFNPETGTVKTRSHGKWKVIQCPM